METYGIYDMRALPAKKVALFSVGLREDSRIKMKLTKQRLTLDQVMRATIVDRLSTLVWFETEDGHNGVNRPRSILATLTGQKLQTVDDTVVYKSGEEFEKEWARLTGKDRSNGDTR